MAVTTTGNVPEVVIRVGTVSVAELGYVLIEVEERVQVTPEGQPEVIASVTVPLKPPPAARFRVDEAVPPAPMLCEVGDAVIVKSLGGGPLEYVMRMFQV